MNWTQRLNCLREEAKRTSGFMHNLSVSKAYYKLLNAIDKRDAEVTKQLIIKMGF